MNDEDTVLFKPICKTLGLPIQPPVEVTVQKKVCKEDPQTGRKIEYNAQDLSAYSVTCSAFVSFNSVPEFGHIESFFVYRSTQFVVVQKFQHFTRRSGGLILIPDMTLTTRVILSFDNSKLSCPLVVAHRDKELWILNCTL